MVSLARSEPGIPILPTEMDVDPFLLNVWNGTLDLRKGELREHRREDRLTKLAPVRFLPDAKCPTWLRFLDRIMAGNADLIGYLQRVIGYSLTSNVDEHCLWLLHGSGQNGKSTFLATILAMLGDYGLQAVSELLMARNSDAHPTERADLFGRRFVCTIEVDEGKRLAESLMKQLTGGDQIRARRLYQDFFTFAPSHKLFLAANHKPEVKGQDFAVWRRIKLIPFTVTIAEHEKDKSLPAKLKKELSGVLNWALRGCLDWQAHGLGEPDEIRLATDEYRAEQDRVGRFIKECCFVCPDVRVKSRDLFAAYCVWSGDKYMTPDNFGRKMAGRGFTRDRGHGGVHMWVGLALIDAENEAG
jgi:putative DNA primase/helicase